VAQKTTVVFVDDLTGEEGDEVTTVEFGLDGAQYEIDLTEPNAQKLREALADYVANARRTGGRRNSGRRPSSTPRIPSPSAGRSPAKVEQNQAIREWARGQGMTVKERGRIPSEVSEAYHKAH
jgi:hypothetical protein